MKKLFLINLIVLEFAIPALAQEKPAVPEAPYPYVSIATGSIVSKQKLAHGFTLCLGDTTFKVVSFRFSYECGQDIYIIDSKGPKLDTTLSLFKTTIHTIPVKAIVCVEEIRVEKGNRFYKLPSFCLSVSD